MSAKVLRDTAIRGQSLYESLYSPYIRASEASNTVISRLKYGSRGGIRTPDQVPMSFSLGVRLGPITSGSSAR